MFFAFDLLRLEGMDLTQTPLPKRRALLRTSLGPSDTVQLSESFSIPAKQMLELIRGHGLEGRFDLTGAGTFTSVGTALPRRRSNPLSAR